MIKDVVSRKIPTDGDNHVRVLKTTTRTYYYEASRNNYDKILYPQNIPVKVIESKPVITWEF